MPKRSMAGSTSLNGISAGASNASPHGRIPPFRGILSSTHLSVDRCPHTIKRCIECIFKTMETACDDTVNGHVDQVCLSDLPDPVRGDVEPVGRVAADTGSHLESHVVVGSFIVHRLVSYYVEGILA